MAGPRGIIQGWTALAAVLAAPFAPAHHSLMQEYDVNESIELRGEVLRLDWVNPHISLYFAVAGKDGAVETWQCEIGVPGTLAQAGWRKEDLPVGSMVLVKANPARDGSPNCSSRNLQLEDGTPVFTLYRSP